MLKHIKLLSHLIALAFGLSSCEKVIDVKLNTSATQMVIEGSITNQNGQQLVKLSQSVPYTDNNTFPAVTGATVNVTDNQGHSWTFTESSPGNYTFGPLKGEPGRIYTLTVNVNNTVYKAASTMPDSVNIDSLDVKVFNFGGEDIKQAQVHYTDPAGVANQYRFVMKVNGVQSKQVYAENDRFTNGNAVPTVLFFNGNNDDDDELKSGDKVDIEMQCIDKNIFNYWFTLSQQSQNGPGGGTIPGNPPSNINNGALGYFSAHTVNKKQMVVK